MRAWRTGSVSATPIVHRACRSPMIRSTSALTSKAPATTATGVDFFESQSTYSGKLSEAGLDILEFEDFGGKDADNLRLVENAHNLLATLRFSGIETPGIRGLSDQMSTLYQAWNSGCFELRRYCAQKP